MEYDDFIRLFPEFKGYNGEGEPPNKDIILMFIEIAKFYVDPYDYRCRMLTGKALKFSIYLMSAHLYSLYNQRMETACEGGNAGNDQGGWIQSASVGDVSVTKASLPAKDIWDWWLAQTPYGQQLLALLKISGIGGLTIGGLPEREGFRKVHGVFL